MTQYNMMPKSDMGKINVVLSFERDFVFDEFLSVMEIVSSSVKQALGKYRDIEKNDFYIADYKSGSFDFNILFGAISAAAAVGSLAVSIVEVLKNKFAKKNDLGKTEIVFIDNSIKIKVFNGEVVPPELSNDKKEPDGFDSLRKEYQTVTTENLNYICDIWMTDARFENNRLQKQIVLNLIQEYPHNNKKDVVFRKVSLVNAYYSTNLKEGMNLFYDDENMVGNILATDFDDKVTRGDLSIIDEIAEVRSNRSKEGKKDAISFASKYCFLHNKSAYPIYDSLSVMILKKLNGLHCFSKHSTGITKDYAKYKALYDDFNSHFFNGALDYDRIDCYLWTLGKIIEIHSKDSTFRNEMFLN